MDMIKGERDPTMDTRIVHSVSVSNKKEQATLRHKERSLRSAKNVQEHIHRREEKDLIRQLTKLQDEKCRRHPDIFTSRSRVQSQMSNARPDSSVVSNSPGHQPHDSLTSGKSLHNAAIGTSFHRVAAAAAAPPRLATGRSVHHAVLQGQQSIDVMHRGGLVTGPSMQHAVIADVLRGGSSRHTGLGLSPQLSQITTNSAAVPGEVHQPAGYGHTIKEHVQREGLSKRRPSHGYMEPRGSHRRSSVSSTGEDFMKGSQMMLARPPDTVPPPGAMGSRFRLNTVSQNHVPRASSHAINLGPSLHRGALGTSSHGMNVPSRFQINRLFGGLSVKEVDAEMENRSRSNSSDDTASTDSKNEKVLKIGFNEEIECNRGNHTKVHFREEDEDIVEQEEEEEEEEERVVLTPSKPVHMGRRGKSDYVVTARKKSTAKPHERNKSSRKTKTDVQNTKPTQSSSKKSTSKSAHVVKLSNEVRRKSSKAHARSDDQAANGHSKSTSGETTRNQIQIPMDTLQELRSVLANNLQGENVAIDELLAMASGQAGLIGASSAYDPSSNSTQNRRYRARLRALQFVTAQIEELNRRQAANAMDRFDPLEFLRCRYLRLSKSNVDQLTDLCRDMGLEVGLHPHMNIDDVNKYVYETLGKSDQSESSSTLCECVEKVLL